MFTFRHVVIMFYVLIALCLFGDASAQLIGFWKCPKAVEPMRRFSAARNTDISLLKSGKRNAPEQGFIYEEAKEYSNHLTGRWYKVRKYPMVFTILSHCPWAKYEGNSRGAVKVEHGTFYAKQILRLKFGGTAHIKSGSQASQLLAAVFYEKFLRDYWVLGTDYNNYLVVYSCVDLILLHFTFLFIFTKDPSPTYSTIQQAERVLNYNKLSDKYLQTVNRTGCATVDNEII